MKILVTGGAGFLGQHLCEALVAKGNEVHCLDNFSTSPHRGSGCVVEKLLEMDVEEVDGLDPCYDQIYHLACPASPVHYQKDPVRTMRTAFIGTMRVFDLALLSKARVLITSTSEVYGDPEVHPQKESYLGNVNTLGPRSCYDEGKRAAEALAYSYALDRGLDVKVARLFNTYGPGMGLDDGRLIPNFVGRAIRGEPLQINGDGMQTRSLCYVSDMIAGLQKLMVSMRTVWPVEAVNLGNPDEKTVLEIASSIASMFDPSPEIIHGPALPDDPRKRQPDISRAEYLLGWTPVVPYKEGLAATVAWFKQSLSDRVQAARTDVLKGSNR